MTSVEFSAITEQIEQYAAELRRERIDRLGQEPLKWLALLPQWTGRLAEHCRFPSPKDPTSWIEDAAAAGVCQRQLLPDDDSDDTSDWPPVRFWMPDIERGEMLGGIRGRTALRSLAADIGRRIHEAPADIERDPGLDRWADLAVRAPVDPRVGEWLMATVSAEVAAGQMSDALDWVYAAEALAPVLGEDMASAAARARRIINLEYRRRLDARFVEHFLRRDRQREAVERLLASSDKPWALHFVGMGGVGKTMLIRYLSGGFTADRGEAIVTTRVDFDHLSPRYPVEEPGQLLRELAGGLTGHLVKGDQVSAYQHFMKCADVLDRMTETSPGRGGIGSPEFEVALDSFAALVATIEQRVVLILDTCEELAKIYPAGEPVPSVEHTFQILERLHGKVDRIRVILAGRRLLASEYSNWRLSPGAERQAWAVSLAKRDYLEFFEIRGFTKLETRRFFAEVRGGERQIPPDVEGAILEVAPESGRVAGIDAAASPDAGAPGEEQRYNPFELALYADWYEDSGGKLTAAEIKSGDIDAYVEGRIVRRLPTDPPVVKALPVLAILGRVDLHIVRTVLALPDATGDRVFRTLSEQEWTGTRSAEESGVTVLEVQPTVLRRLEDYFDRPARTHVRDTTRQRLRRELPGLLERRPLDAAAIEHVAAAMRILPSADALSLWDELVRRIRRSGEWAWGASACARLLAEDGNGIAPHPVLDAAVRAVYIGAVRRRDPAYDAAQDWAFVAAAVYDQAGEPRCLALTDRAALGIAADDARHRGRFAKLEDGGAFTAAWWRAQATSGDDQCLAAALATAEAFLDAGADEPSGTLLPVEDVRQLADRAANRDDPVLAAFAQVVLARTRLRAGLDASGFEQAERLVGAGPQGMPPVDWPLPRSARARILLVWLHATTGAPLYAPSPGVLPGWIDEALGGDDIEHERLASAALLRLLADGPVDDGRIRALDTAVRRLPALTALCPAHVETPPLAASVIRAWVALGEPDAARKLVEAWEESSPSAGRDPATTAQVRLATVYLVRRMRWYGLRDSLVLTLTTSASPERVLAGRAAQVLLGNTTEEGLGEQSPQAADIRWRTASALNDQDAAAVLRTIVPHLDEPGTDTVVAAQLAVDRQEAERLGRRAGRSVSFPAAADTPGTDHLIERQLETGAGSPAAARELRAIRLRRWALASGEWPEQEDAPHDWAETALEEGELLALRLPGEGARLLLQAARMFEQAGDLHGTTIALIRSVIADYHDGNSDGAVQTLNRLKPRYDRLRALAGPDVPAWDSLVDWVRARPEDATSGGAWDGWLIRLAVCLARRSGQRLEPPVHAAELNLTPAPRYRGPITRVWRVIKAVGLTAGGLWAAFFAVVGGASIGRTGLSTLGWHPPAFVGWAVGLVGATAVFIAAVTLVAGLTSPLMKFIGAQFRLVADLEPVVSEDGSPHRAYVWVRVRPKRPWLGLLAAYFGGYIENKSELWSFLRRKSTGSGTPRPRAAELALRPDPLRTPAPLQLTRALARALNVHIDELVLRVGPKVAPGAWEAALNLTLITSSDKGIARDFRSFRAYEARASHPAPTRPGAVAVLCARPFALLAEASWEADGVTPQLFYGEDLRDFERVPHVNVLHLIGTPVPDELGPVLALEGSAAHTLQPDRLPLSDARVIIVQAEPTRSSVSADPRTALLRAIAYDIAVASAGAAVIVLPALPSHLAAKLTEEIARALAAGQPSRRDLLDLIHRLREMVFLAGDPEDAVTARALIAFDVCLYLGGITSGQSARP